MWWHGDRRPPALTADTASGAGLQGGNEGEDQPPNGDAIPAPPADGNTESDPDPGCAVVAQREPPLLAVRAALSMISSAVGSFGHPPLGLRRYGAGLQPVSCAGWPQAAILLIFASL